MAIYGALGENPAVQGSRRGEMIDRGVVTTAAGVATVIVPAPMRKITHFQVSIDDKGTAVDGVTAATGAAVATASINSASQTIAGIVYPANSVLNINAYVATSTSNPQLIQTAVVANVRYLILGTL